MANNEMEPKLAGDGYYKTKMPIGKPAKRPKLCPAWPNCRCIIQGYMNEREPNDCGRKPR